MSEAKNIKRIEKVPIPEHGSNHIEQITMLLHAFEGQYNVNIKERDKLAEILAHAIESSWKQSIMHFAINYHNAMIRKIREFFEEKSTMNKEINQMMKDSLLLYLTEAKSAKKDEKGMDKDP